MLAIHLKDLHFFAHHGVHPEETLLGNSFIVNLHLHYEPLPEVVVNLADTIDYAQVFSMVAERMQRPTPLLETIAMALCYEVMERFEQVQRVFVSIEKSQPPIVGLQGGVVVSFQLVRAEAG
jgi:7,8-dihydroneopterin aldolase/epimerase/oxygenase